MVRKVQKTDPPQVPIPYPILDQSYIFAYICPSYAWCNPTKCEYYFTPPTDLVLKTGNFRCKIDL